MKCPLVHQAGCIMQPSWKSLGWEGAGAPAGLDSTCVFPSVLFSEFSHLSCSVWNWRIS